MTYFPSNNKTIRTAKKIPDPIKAKVNESRFKEIILQSINLISKKEIVNEINSFTPGLRLKEITDDTLESAKCSLILILTRLMENERAYSLALKADSEDAFKPEVRMPTSTKSYNRNYSEYLKSLTEGKINIEKDQLELGLVSFRVQQVVEAVLRILNIFTLIPGGHSHTCIDRSQCINFDEIINSKDVEKIKVTDNFYYIILEKPFSKIQLTDNYIEVLSAPLSTELLRDFYTLINTGKSYSEIKKEINKKRKTRVNPYTGLYEECSVGDNVVKIKDVEGFTLQQRRIHKIDDLIAENNKKEKRKQKNYSKDGFGLYKHTSFREKELIELNDYIYNCREFVTITDLLLNKRIFTNNDCHGGRLYSSFNQFSSQSRQGLLDSLGLEMVEVDIHAAGLNFVTIKNLLTNDKAPTVFERNNNIYEKLGDNFFTSYKEVNKYTESWVDKILCDSNIKKAIIKKMCQPSIFAHDENEAWNAIRLELEKIGMLHGTEGKDDDYRKKQTERWKSFVLSNAPKDKTLQFETPHLDMRIVKVYFYEALIRNIPYIKESLFEDESGFVMACESLTMETISLDLWRKGSPNIIVFDAIYVKRNQESYVKSILKNTMIDSVKKALVNFSNFYAKEIINLARKDRVEVFEVVNDNDDFSTDDYNGSKEFFSRLPSYQALARRSLKIQSSSTLRNYTKRTDMFEKYAATYHIKRKGFILDSLDTHNPYSFLFSPSSSSPIFYKKSSFSLINSLSNHNIFSSNIICKHSDKQLHKIQNE